MVAKSCCNEPKFKKISFTKFYKIGLFSTSNFTMKICINVNHLPDYDSIAVDLSTDVFSLFVQALVPELSGSLCQPTARN